MQFLRLSCALLLLTSLLPVSAQNPPAATQAASATRNNVAAASKASTPAATPVSKEDSRRRFVIDVVNSAVALPQPDPQDRLRVLYAAANVASPFDSKMTQQFAKEGTRIETELVSQGEKPAVSMLAGGHVDCTSAQTFVQSIPPTSVVEAEQSLLGAITKCPRQVNDAAKRKLDAGLQQGVVAARPLLALMEAEGVTGNWSRATFDRIFASLPSDSSAAVQQAPDLAAVLTRGAPAMDKDAVKSAGVKFLQWLAKLPDQPQRQVAINMATESLKKVLGEDAYQELLRSDVTAQQVAATAGQAIAIPPPEEESASVLQAMSNPNDRRPELQSMPVSLRAREAAAAGFASGNAGDRKAADGYFDIAFSSLDQVWSDRARLKTSAPEVIEEVSQAAAQVDPLAALQRSQRLTDPTAEAISMLAVAQVVASKQ